MRGFACFLAFLVAAGVAAAGVGPVSGAVPVLGVVFGTSS